MDDQVFEKMADEVQAIQNRLHDVRQSFAAPPPLYLDTTRFALALARISLLAVQKQIDASDFLVGRKLGEPTGSLTTLWASQVVLGIAGNPIDAFAFTAWLIAHSPSLPELHEEVGPLLDDQVAYAKWVRDRYTEFLASF